MEHTNRKSKEMITPMRRPEGIAQMLSAQEDYKKQIEEAEQLRKDRFEQTQEERAETIEKGRQDMYDAYVDRYKILQQSPLYAPILPPMMSFEEFFSMENPESKRPAMSPGVNEDVMADMMRRMELNRMGRAYGGRIGFEEGSKDTVGNDIIQRKRANYFDLDRDTFMTMEQYLKSAQSDRDLDRKADGGRIGFREGKTVQPLQIPSITPEIEIQLFKNELKKLNPDATEQELDDAAEKMYRGELALKDSERGIKSLVAKADDDDPSPLLDDPEDRTKTDIDEVMRLLESAELGDSDLYSLYDAAVEDGRFSGTFEEFKQIMSQTGKQKAEGIMQMVA